LNWGSTEITKWSAESVDDSDKRNRLSVESFDGQDGRSIRGTQLRVLRWLAGQQQNRSEPANAHINTNSRPNYFPEKQLTKRSKLELTLAGL